MTDTPFQNNGGHCCDSNTNGQLPLDFCVSHVSHMGTRYLGDGKDDISGGGPGSDAPRDLVANHLG